jgi:electron transfer flavoprotein beta subunit
MKAKKKEIKQVPIADTGIDFKNRLEIIKVEEPPVRVGGRKVENVDELINVLKNEVGVI